MAFFTFSFESIFCIIDNINFSLQGELMSNIDATAVAQRIDTVLDILVAGDYHSAIRNLEILKSELLAENGTDNASESTQPKAPWEV
ncbi:hypothetical protein ECNIH3_11660 [Enterobacter hormaechei subsp. hoffmannii ECNIH3]|nr:hypothetical protein ECNIH3_11660 [Enterobacter hormaechei subsp. hoffmannii ECNIH3]AIN28284.1 hypothetical protein ECR091_11600 [Enterobacter hormaechei subsp. hoffmannii ECR091]